MAVLNSNLGTAIAAIIRLSRNTYAGNNRAVLETYNGTQYIKFTYTSSGSYTPPSLLQDIPANILLVAGGGAGMGDWGGGGGAGGLVIKENQTLISTQSITIGAGGTTKGNVGSAGRPHNFGSGQVGQNSSFGTLVANGGGAARGYNASSWAGGSGGSGGGGSNSSSGNLSTATQPTSATGGFGNSGSGGNTGAQAYGGGGGGAGGAGSSNGAAGSGYFYFGSTYATGGNGPGVGTRGESGQANTGNGGNGHQDPGTGGNGGSGIAIIRYNLSTTL